MNIHEHVRDFMHSPEVKDRWKPEVDTAVSAVEAGRVVLLFGGFGLGKSTGFWFQTCNQLKAMDYEVYGSPEIDGILKGVQNPHSILFELLMSDPENFKANVGRVLFEDLKTYDQNPIPEIGGYTAYATFRNQRVEAADPARPKVMLLDEYGDDEPYLSVAGSLMELGLQTVAIAPGFDPDSRQRVMTGMEAVAAEHGREVELIDTSGSYRHYLPAEAVKAVLIRSGVNRQLASFFAREENVALRHPRTFLSLVPYLSRHLGLEHPYAVRSVKGLKKNLMAKRITDAMGRSYATPLEELLATRQGTSESILRLMGNLGIEIDELDLTLHPKQQERLGGDILDYGD